MMAGLGEHTDFLLHHVYRGVPGLLRGSSAGRTTDRGQFHSDPVGDQAEEALRRSGLLPLAGRTAAPELSNNPADQVGVIAINTPLEVDIYGQQLIRTYAEPK